MKRILSSAFISTAAVLLTTNKVHAESTSIGIYPPLVRINALPKAQVRTPYTIVNRSNTEILATIRLIGFKASNEYNGTINYYSSETTPVELKQLMSDVKIFDGENQIKSIKIYPKESKNVIMEFIAPDTQKDYYFSIALFEEVTKTLKEEETTVRITNVLASNVILSVGASQEDTAHISELTTNAFKLSGPVILKLQVNNTSKNFISATGNVNVYNIFGEKVGSVKLKPTLILSGSQRVMTNNDSTSTIKTVNWDEKFTFGFYTAKAVIHINETAIIEKSTSFFSIPLSILILVVVILFVLISIVSRVIKKINFKA